MSYVVASVVSAPAPIDGNDHNSSKDFQFVNLPGGGNLTVQITDNPNADNITFNLWEDINNRRDQTVETDLHNGSTFPADRVDEDDEYYIGDPANADDQNFTVTFLAG